MLVTSFEARIKGKKKDCEKVIDMIKNVSCVEEVTQVKRGLWVVYGEHDDDMDWMLNDCYIDNETSLDEFIEENGLSFEYLAHALNDDDDGFYEYVLYKNGKQETYESDDFCRVQGEIFEEESDEDYQGYPKEDFIYDEDYDCYIYGRQCGDMVLQ